MLLISDSAIEMAISMFKGSCQSLQLQQVRVLRRTCEVGNKKTHRLVMVEANSYFSFSCMLIPLHTSPVFSVFVVFETVSLYLRLALELRLVRICYFVSPSQVLGLQP